jgi:3-deoxy-manno-octulosonate cytidylyltransferase (CMP-KDO synthetase)
MRVVGLIPCRLKSTRLPSKALLMIDSLPLIVHTMKRAQLAKSLDDVYVCTDSKEIADVVQLHGGKYIMTKSDHSNGTERIAEAAESLEGDLFVCIQGDEPLVNPKYIENVIAEAIKRPEWEIIVPSLPIARPENPHIVKIVHDVNYRIIFMSRAVIPQPFNHRPGFFLKHLSVITFKPEALKKYASLPPSPLQNSESIELLRAIEHGMVLGTVLLEGDSISVDIREDYARAKVLMMTDEIRKQY